MLGVAAMWLADWAVEYMSVEIDYALQFQKQ